MADEQQEPDSSGESFITPFVAAAMQLHEMYSAYITAGFTPAQALTIVLSILNSNAPKNEM